MLPSESGNVTAEVNLTMSLSDPSLGHLILDVNPENDILRSRVLFFAISVMKHVVLYLEGMAVRKGSGWGVRGLEISVHSYHFLSGHSLIRHDNKYIVSTKTYQPPSSP